MASRVRLKRLFPVLLLPALLAAIVIVSNAAAGVGIADEPCPNVAGENTNTCPEGTVGVAYTIQFKEAEGSGCGPGLQTFTIDSGNFPPGLTLSSEGVVTGTPTSAGSFKFYVKIAEPQPATPACAGSVSEKEFTIPIKPGVPVLPKLTIGPEQEGVPKGTVGSPFTLAMTASVADAKTWSISAGALPAGLTINPADGVISGTPTGSGSFGFTVLAVIDATRSDTKALSITVRDPLTITPPDLFDEVSRVARTEVGVRFLSSLVASGGLGPYTWTLTGTLPDGIEFDDVSGSLSGRPELPGTYRFGLAVADAEGRTVAYAGRVIVAPRLAIVATRLKPGKVGQLFRQKLKATGGVAALNVGDVSMLKWRVKRGPLPRGIRFDPLTGSFVGIPVKGGSWVVMVEIVDALRVKATASVRIVVAAPPKPKKR